MTHVLLRIPYFPLRMNHSSFPKASSPINPNRSMKKSIKITTLSAMLLCPALHAGDFEDWKQTVFTSAEQLTPEISASFADPDSDGRVNLLEYALGTNPKMYDANEGYAVSRDSQGRLVFEFRQPLYMSDVVLIPQITSNLGTVWTSGPTRLELVSSQVDSPGFLTKILRDTLDPASVSKRFVRLMADFDRDMDGLPDQWELLNGLSSYDYSDWNSDLDGDGRTAYQEFLDGTDPLTHDQPQPEVEIPSAPKDVVITTLEDGSRLVKWVDTSDNETFFEVVETLPDGTVIVLARVGPGQTSVVIPPSR